MIINVNTKKIRRGGKFKKWADGGWVRRYEIAQCRVRYVDDVEQGFPTFFGSRHPYLVVKVFGGTPSWSHRYKTKELSFLAAPLALARGTLVFRGTPVGNH